MAFYYLLCGVYYGLPCTMGFLFLTSVGKESACNAGDPSSIPGLGRSDAEGIRLPTPVFLGFPHDSAGKESACNVGNLGSVPGLGRSSGEGKGYPLQYSGLENSMNFIVRGVAKSWIWLGNFHNNVVCTVAISLHRGTKGMLHTMYSTGFTNWGTLSGISYKQQIIVNFPLNYFLHSQREKSP